ncbi:glycosyltransferase [Methanofollis ethanolicus]|jgi:glycosyltransferase involved in cell wall biosynthesis|uniref:glycosyltransferase n=1 Tax=Methanofollis ethanolicus TaxID=488124 RepID=UPI00082E415C|nr:glycosyltransferase [Methanofollis ethanolicus]
MNSSRLHPQKISVVVPVRNGVPKIERCLQALLNQTLQPYEIIVVDGHSTDATVEIARKFQTRVVFEDYGTVGGARQVGVEEAGGDYVAFTDADCIPQKDWLENLVREFEDGIAGVGGGIKNIGTGLWEESIALALDTFLGSANSVQDRVLPGKRVVRSISGCSSMYRKKDLVTVGGFDVKLSINEDTELNTRMQRLGTLVYTPDALVHHNQERTIVEFVRRMHFFGYGRGINRLWDLQVVPPLAAIGILLLAFIAPLASAALVVIYAGIVGAYTIAIFGKVRKADYLLSVPIVYLLEHIAYMFGFWTGTVASITKRSSP